MRYTSLLILVIITLLLGGCRKKTDGISAQMAYEGVEFVPALNIENEAGSINLRDYLK